MLTCKLKNSALLRLLIYIPLIFVVIYALKSAAFSTTHNNFKLDDPLIPVNEIHHGGPPRDGIPAIDHPEFITADDARYLTDSDRVLGLIINNQAKAYPIKILNWHEIVNDKEIVISYCPLCGTGMAFKSMGMDFGVSGLLYNSDMLLYDRQTESLWSQIMAQAINGPHKGKKLDVLLIEHSSWINWKTQHPDTQVLSNNTHYRRDYSKSPYGQYETSDRLYFPVSHRSRQFHPKEKVIGIELNGKYKAYAFSELDKSAVPVIKDNFSGQTIEIQFNSQHRSGTVIIAGKSIASLTAYWFAWYTFHPDTEIYRHNQH